MRSTLAALARNRELRRLEIAYVAFNAAEYGVWLAMLVYAYAHGGSTVAALVAVAQLAPAAAAAPLVAVLVDRLGAARVLLGGYLAQALAMAATAAAIAGHVHPLAAYASAAIAATAVTSTRPAQAALLPSLARSADELTAANVVSSWVENGSVVVATATAGLLLGAGGSGLVFAVFALGLTGAAVLVTPLCSLTPGGPTVDGSAPGFLSGVRAVVADRRPRVLVALLGLESVLVGALDVLLVVLVLAVLRVDRSWVGYLNAAFAAGGVAGSLGAARLIGRSRLALPIVAGALACGAAIAAVTVAGSITPTAALLVLAGAGRSLFDVASRTLLQRVTPADVLGRVFGVLEGTVMLALGIGSLAIVPLVRLSSEAAIVGVAAILPVAALVARAALVRIDSSAKVPLVEIALLRSLKLFAALPAPELETLARSLQPIDVLAGTAVVSEGESGDRFFAIVDGALEVSQDGRLIRSLGRGDGFGEIALVADVPRTATVTALTAARLYALDRESFLTAVTGHAPTRSTTSRLVADRLAGAEAR